MGMSVFFVFSSFRAHPAQAPALCIRDKGTHHTSPFTDVIIYIAVEANANLFLSIKLN
jgi:hypothetical protein